MQQIGSGGRFSWRATRSPSPRNPLAPALHGSLAASAPARPHRGPGGLVSFDRLVGPLATLILVATLVYAPRHWRAETEALLERGGLGLDEVSVTGQKFTDPAAIFDALDLDRVRTLLSFDTRAAQERIEALPWIRQATISRILPDRVEIAVTERAPFAVWHRPDGAYLIDRSGRELGPVAADAVAGLPHVSGAGAPADAARLLAVVDRYPAVSSRLERADRIGDRRWTLRLNGGLVVHLPEQGEDYALRQLVRLDASGEARRFSEIDLRVAGRMRVRELPAGPGGAKAADTPSTTDRS